MRSSVYGVRSTQYITGACIRAENSAAELIPLVWITFVGMYINSSAGEGPHGFNVYA